MSLNRRQNDRNKRREISFSRARLSMVGSLARQANPLTIQNLRSPTKLTLSIHFIDLVPQFRERVLGFFPEKRKDLLPVLRTRFWGTKLGNPFIISGLQNQLVLHSNENGQPVVSLLIKDRIDLAQVVLTGKEVPTMRTVKRRNFTSMEKTVFLQQKGRSLIEKPERSAT